MNNSPTKKLPCIICLVTFPKDTFHPLPTHNCPINFPIHISPPSDSFPPLTFPSDGMLVFLNCILIFIGLEQTSSSTVCNRSQTSWTVSSKRWRNVEVLWLMVVSVNTVLSTLFLFMYVCLYVCGFISRNPYSLSSHEARHSDVPSYMQHLPGILIFVGLLSRKNRENVCKWR